MKKLMIIAALLIAGVAANAATFKWTAANIKAHDGTTAYSGSVSLFSYAQGADISTAILAVTGTSVAGVIKDGTTVGLTFSNDAYVTGNTYSFFMVIQDGDYTFNSSLSTPAVIKPVLAQATATATLAFGTMATATAASNWTGSAVPEPTSGLLLLLGMAGLALKRKVA